MELGRSTGRGMGKLIFREVLVGGVFAGGEYLWGESICGGRVFVGGECFGGGMLAGGVFSRGGRECFGEIVCEEAYVLRIQF
jgi:hypothetical protein